MEQTPTHAVTREVMYNKNYAVGIHEVGKISFLMMAAAVQERLTLQYYDVSRRSLCIHASCASCEKRKTASSGNFKFD